MIIELTPKKPLLLYPDMKKGIMTHSNRFQSEAFHSRFNEEMLSIASFYRDRRLEYRWSQMAPNICDENVSEAYMDHLGALIVSVGIRLRMVMTISDN